VTKLQSFFFTGQLPMTTPLGLFLETLVLLQGGISFKLGTGKSETGSIASA
jgi:hypothetical protein